MSHIFISRSFNAAMWNIILTESLHTTLEYNTDASTCVRWLPPTYLVFLVMSKFTSYIRWNVIILYLIRNLLPLSLNLKAASTFFIFFIVASCQYIFPWNILSSTASFYVAGISIPNFIFFINLMDAMLITTFTRLRAGSTHYANAGSLLIFFSFAYHAISKRLI